MSFLTDDEIHFNLLLGKPIFITGIGEFKAPTIEDISRITESKFQTLTSSLLIGINTISDKEQLRGMSDYQIFSLLVQLNPGFREMYFEAIQFYINEVPEIDTESGTIYFHVNSEAYTLTEEKFTYIKKLVEIANNFSSQPEEEQISAGNERARKFMEQLAKKKEIYQKVKKPTINLHSIISAVAWKSYAISDISKLTIYQLYDGYKRLTYIDNYDKTMTAVYAGTVDTSKMKVNELNWANIIKSN